MLRFRRTLEPDAYVAFGRCSIRRNGQLLSPAPHNWLGHITSGDCKAGRRRSSNSCRGRRLPVVPCGSLVPSLASGIQIPDVLDLLPLSLDLGSQLILSRQVEFVP